MQPDSLAAMLKAVEAASALELPDCCAMLAVE